MLAGCLAIYSASTSKIGDNVSTQNHWWKQCIFVFVCLFAIYVLLRTPMPVFELAVIPLYVLNMIALILVLFTPAIGGSHRWFSIGGFNYQPSESAKLLTILVVSRVLAKDNLGELRQLLYGFALVSVPVFLIIIEPDFGTTLVFWTSLMAMFVAAGLPLFFLLLMVSPVVSIVFSIHWMLLLLWMFILVLLLIRSRLSWVAITISGIANLFAALIMPVFWNGLKDYQQSRILTFIDPMRDPLGAGYQIIQSKIAVGSGAVSGKGWLEGTQKNMNFLPEHHTDFIFSVVGEEFGFIGSILLLGLFAAFFWRLSTAVSELKVAERRIATAGICGYLMFQSFINIGMNIGLVPATGIPLPFISYGGSNLLINSMAIGVVLKFLNERGFMK